MRPATQSAIVQALSAALQAHGRGALDEAEQWLDQASRIAASHPDLLHLRGLVALGKRQAGKAVELIERATRSSPRTAMYWNNLGVARRAAGDLATTTPTLIQRRRRRWSSGWKPRTP